MKDMPGNKHILLFICTSLHVFFMVRIRAPYTLQEVKEEKEESSPPHPVNGVLRKTESHRELYVALPSLKVLFQV